jgi:lysozyme
MTDRLSPDDPALIASVKLGEGCVLRAYPDPMSPRGMQMALPPKRRAPGWSTLSGAPFTIGYGHCGAEVRDGLNWTLGQAEAALAADLADACQALDHRLPWWRDMTLNRQRALAEMCFNLGVGRLLGFHRMLADLEAAKFAAAADEALASAWHAQVGKRAERLAEAIRAG